MTQAELCKLLQSTGYPVNHIEFESPPTVPFIAYLYTNEEQRGSDNKNLIKESSIRVELYTEYKDTQAEVKLDSVLNFVQFNKSKTKISDEKLLTTVYEFNLVEKI